MSRVRITSSLSVGTVIISCIAVIFLSSCATSARHQTQQATPSADTIQNGNKSYKCQDGGFANEQYANGKLHGQQRYSKDGATRILNYEYGKILSEERSNSIYKSKSIYSNEKMVHEETSIYNNYSIATDKSSNGTMTAEIRYFDGNVYTGETANGEKISSTSICGWELNYDLDQPNGSGKLSKSNGDVYEGTFTKGKFSSGRIGFANGESFRGDWISGNGTMKYANGNVYDGQWNDGKPSGMGVMKYQTGDTFDGNWSNGAPYGKGKLTTVSGIKYVSSDRYGGSFGGLSKKGGFEIDKGNGATVLGFFKDDNLVISSDETSIVVASKFIDDFRSSANDYFIQEQVIPIIIKGLKKSKPAFVADLLEKHFRLFSEPQLDAIERQHGRDSRVKKTLVMVKECREISRSPERFFNIHLTDASSAEVGENWRGPLRSGGSSVLKMKFGVEVESLAKTCTVKDVVVEVGFTAKRSWHYESGMNNLVKMFGGKGRPTSGSEDISKSDRIAFAIVTPKSKTGSNLIDLGELTNARSVGGTGIFGSVGGESTSITGITRRVISTR